MTGSLTDTHCHLTAERLLPEIEAVLARAAAAGVGRVVVPGVDLDSSRRAVELAEKTDGLSAAVGIHPHSANEWNADIHEQLRELASSRSVVAIGEIGLDYYRELSPRTAQREALAGQLALAHELELPVVIHNREATPELLEVLIEWAAGLGNAHRARAGVLHAFSGGSADANAAIAAGFFIGIAGPVTYPNAEPLRATLGGLPADRLVIETDSPYLAPQPRRGKRNEPAYLPYIAQELAAILGDEIDRTIELTSRNASLLFNWSNGIQNTHIH